MTALLPSWAPDVVRAARSLPDALAHRVLPDPLHLPLLLVALASTICYIVGLATHNVGWVDRIYTTLPLATSAAIIWWAHSHGYAAALPRLLLVLAVQAVWSVRLTYHTTRRGLYSFSGEDYRYVWLRARVPGWFFQLVHLFAVVLLQPILIASLSFPLVALLRPEEQLARGKAGVPAHSLAGGGDGVVLHAGDIALVFISLSCVILEAAGDEAMFVFQEGKHAALARERAALEERDGSLASALDGELSLPDRLGGLERRASRRLSVPDVGRELVAEPAEYLADVQREPAALYTPAYYPGFPTRGLHSLVRHPNFLGEQLFHLTVALWPICASASAYPAQCLLPPLALSLLFSGSTLLTETITASKYPLYREYRRVLGKFAIQETLLKLVYFEFFASKEKERIEALLYPREVSHIGVLRRISSSSVSTASSSSKSSGDRRLKEE